MRINDSAEVRVVMDPVEIGQFIRHSPGVLHDMTRRAERVQNAARAQVRLGHVGGGERNAVKRGEKLRPNLRYTIVKRVIKDPTGMPAVLVGSASPIALLHHEGTKPHIILPRNARFLVFWGARTGKIVYAKRVNHPGTKPNRYLTDNLHLAL